jgi:hypothetical protein
MITTGLLISLLLILIAAWGLEYLFSRHLAVYADSQDSFVRRQTSTSERGRTKFSEQPSWPATRERWLICLKEVER